MSALIPGARSILTKGNRVFTDLTNLITLHARTATTAIRNCTFRKSSATAGYAVTGGKTLYVDVFEIVTVDLTGLSPIIAQTDNDVGFATATTFTNAVYFCGATTSTFSVFRNNSSLPAGSVFVDDHFPVASGKYLSINSQNDDNGLVARAYGYEV